MAQQLCDNWGGPTPMFDTNAIPVTLKAHERQQKKMKK
jgi:hypothetical protein